MAQPGQAHAGQARPPLRAWVRAAALPMELPGMEGQYQGVEVAEA